MKKSVLYNWLGIACLILALFLSTLFFLDHNTNFSTTAYISITAGILLGRQGRREDNKEHGKEPGYKVPLTKAQTRRIFVMPIFYLVVAIILIVINYTS